MIYVIQDSKILDGCLNIFSKYVHCHTFLFPLRFFSVEINVKKFKILKFFNVFNENGTLVAFLQLFGGLSWAQFQN